ncbi:MAG TPA: histidine kinase [Puia sp.]|jgi:sensor histidine kinase YesM|nr:histidine kinase [Puia sp.]
MFKAYNIRSGIVFSLFIALFSGVPVLIHEAIGQFTLNTVLLFIRILICWFIHHFFLLHRFRTTFKGANELRAFISILLGTAISFFINYYFNFKADPILYWNRSSVMTTDQALLINLFRSSVISGFCYFVVYYLYVNMQLQNSRLENEYLKQDQLKAQLFSLQQQLSPHFLFNSLSTLKTIAPDKETKTYVMQLSNVYRYLLTFNDSQIVSVRTELAFMNSYLYIIKERFEDALQVSVSIDESFLDHYMPPLTLQILVENALKHNIISMDQPLYLHIYSHEAGILTVANSFQPKLSTEESNGKGLQNIKDRYELLAGRKIEICPNKDLFIVNLPLLEP